jgi:hypothetical protein
VRKPGLKPALIPGDYAALKGRSSTAAHQFMAAHQSMAARQFTAAHQFMAAHQFTAARQSMAAHQFTRHISLRVFPQALKALL